MLHNNKSFEKRKCECDGKRVEMLFLVLMGVNRGLIGGKLPGLGESPSGCEMPNRCANP